MQELRPSAQVLHIIYGEACAQGELQRLPGDMSAPDCRAAMAFGVTISLRELARAVGLCCGKTEILQVEIYACRGLQIAADTRAKRRETARRNVLELPKQYLCDERGAIWRCVGGSAVWLTTGRLA